MTPEKIKELRELARKLAVALMVRHEVYASSSFYEGILLQEARKMGLLK